MRKKYNLHQKTGKLDEMAQLLTTSRQSVGVGWENIFYLYFIIYWFVLIWVRLSLPKTVREFIQCVIEFFVSMLKSK